VPGIRIGQLLVEQGVLSDVQVEHILKVQKESGRPFGDLAERLFGISPKAIEDAWVEQYVRTAGVVDLDEIEVEKDCLRLLNRRQAWQFHLLPTNRDLGELNVATTPQNLVRAVNFAIWILDCGFWTCAITFRNPQSPRRASPQVRSAPPRALPKPGIPSSSRWRFPGI
jgi:hypothetical protein